MKKIKKYFHLLMMISFIILEIMLLTISIAGFKLNDKYDILWICSKLETINQIVNNADALDDENCGYPIKTEDVITTPVKISDFPSQSTIDTKVSSTIISTYILKSTILSTNVRRLDDDYKICYHNNNQNTIRLVYSNSNDECSYFMIQKIFVLDQKTLNYFFDTKDEDTSKNIDEYLKGNILKKIIKIKTLKIVLVIYVIKFLLNLKLLMIGIYSYQILKKLKICINMFFQIKHLQ